LDISSEKAETRRGSMAPHPERHPARKEIGIGPGARPRRTAAPVGVKRPPVLARLRTHQLMRQIKTLDINSEKTKTGHGSMAAHSKRHPARKGRAKPTWGNNERTRVNLMKAAERLFGDYGIDAVGLRAVCEAAHQKNNNAVQYHFGDKLGLLRAIFDWRETQLQPMRQAMLEQGEAQQRLGDVRWLLRVMFEPNFRLYRDQHDVSYIKLHAAYITTHRPRGVPHPVDDQSPSCVSYRRAI